MLHGYRWRYYSYQKWRFYEDVADGVEERFDTSNYEVKDHCLQEKRTKWLD